MSILASDTFIRSNQSGWGTASDGNVWNNTVGSGTISIISNEGVISGTSGNDVDMRLGSGSSADVDLTVRFAINNLGDVFGLQGRYSAPGGSVTCYKFLYYDGQVHINKSVGGNNSNLTNAGSGISTGTFYWLRFQIKGTSLSGKIWLDGSSEPGSWTTTTTDSSISASGGFAVLVVSGSGSGVQVDHFTATEIVVNLSSSIRSRFLIKSKLSSSSRNIFKVRSNERSTIYARFLIALIPRFITISSVSKYQISFNTTVITPNTSIKSTATITDNTGVVVTNVSAISVLVEFPDRTTSTYTLAGGDIVNSGNGVYTLSYNIKGPGLQREYWSVIGTNGNLLEGLNDVGVSF